MASHRDGQFIRIAVVAQDPSIKSADGQVLMSEVKLPGQLLLDGPKSSRFEVIDYELQSDTLYDPVQASEFLGLSKGGLTRCTDADYMRDGLLDDPQKHQMNAFAIAASTLFQFERALGRTVHWGFKSHQLKIIPHAFPINNAFYSRRDQCLAFGYFADVKDRDKTIYTCLSHDIIVHETTHAILDGLRTNFDRPSSNDQAAFHEGYADVIALLSVMTSQALIAQSFNGMRGFRSPSRSGTVSYSKAYDAILDGSFLQSIAEEYGTSASGGRDRALRRSATIRPNKNRYKRRDKIQAHDLGELLVAAIMLGFNRVWAKRLLVKQNHRPSKHDRIAAWRVYEEGAKAAQHLLSLVIRAIDYLPPVHLEFPDFLTALLTADKEVCPDDTYGYRNILVEAFEDYGIPPAVAGHEHLWGKGTLDDADVAFGHGNIETNRWDQESLFRLIWENQRVLGLTPDIYTKVNSVRPCWRVGPEGFVLRETVVEYAQILKNVNASELGQIIEKSRGMPSIMKVPEFMEPDTRVNLEGGGTLIFDEFGRLKYHVHNRLLAEQQTKVLTTLWRRGYFSHTDNVTSRRAMATHLARMGINGNSWPVVGAGWEAWR